MKFVLVILMGLVYLSGCVPTPSNTGSVKIGGDAKTGIANSNKAPAVNLALKVNSVNIINNQLIILGQGFDKVLGVQVNGPGLDDYMVIESKTANQIIANASKAISFLISETFNLILNTAEASATFQITFDIPDKSITAIKLNQMSANDGDVLTWNQSLGLWQPTDLNNLTFGGTWDASDGGVLPGKTQFLNSLSPSNGTYYVVSVAGSYDHGDGNGLRSWSVGDWAIYRDDSKWDRIVNSNEVSSINGKKGTVVLNLDDVADVSATDTISAASVYTALVKDGSVWKTGSVLSNEAGAVGTANLATDSVTKDKMANNSVGSDEIENNAITSNKIADGTIVLADLAAGFGLNANQVASGSCTVSNTSFCELAGLNIASGDLNSELQKFFKTDGTRPLEADLNMDGFRLINLGGFGLSGAFETTSTDSGTVAADTGNTTIPVTIKDDTTGKTFGGDTSGRMLRFNRLNSGTNHIYDIGLNSNNEFTIYKKDSLDSAFTIDSTGRVGINKLVPAAQLHVNGEGNTLRLEGTASSYIELFPDGPGARKGYFGFFGAPDNFITLKNESGASGHIKLIPGASANVGVGVDGTDPADKLHILGSDPVTAIRVENDAADGDAVLALKNSSAGPTTDMIWYFGVDDSDSQKLKLIPSTLAYNASNAKVTFDASGSVGIGTQSPSNQLEVSDSVALADHPALRLTNADTGASNSVSLELLSKSGTITVPAKITGDGIGSNDIDLVFHTVDNNVQSEKMRIGANGILGLGTNDTAAGILSVYGDGTASTEGGELRLHMAADHDTTYDYYRLEASSDSLKIGPTGVDVLTMDATGNVGIGTLTPASKLHVNGTITATNFSTTTGMADIDEIQINGNVITTNTTLSPNQDLVLTSNGTGLVNPTKIDTTSNAVTNVMNISHTNSGGNGADGIGVGVLLSAEDSAGNNEAIAAIEAVFTTATSGAEVGDLLFKTNSTGTLSTAMTIKGGGNVGIGTTSPSHKLDVAGEGRFTKDNNSDFQVAAIIVNRVRADATAPGQGMAGRLRFDLEGFTDNSNAQGAGGIEVGWETAQTDDTTARDSFMEFNVMKDNVNKDAMRISSEGFLGINTTTPEQELDVGGQIIVGDKTTAGSVQYRSNNANFHVELKASDGMASNFTMTLPSTDGTSGSVLVTDGSGVLSFTAAPGITGLKKPDLSSIILSTDNDGDLTFGNGTFTKTSASSTGDIILNDGTADTPGVKFYQANNDNFGIDVSGGNLRFVKNLDEASPIVGMTMDASGRVGIGTSTQTADLEIVDTVNGTNFTMNGGSGSNETTIYLSEAGDSGFKMTYRASDNILRFVPRVTGTDQTEAISILRSNGNVGIGTTDPDAPLEIGAAGATAENIRISSNAVNEGGQISLMDGTSASENGAWEIDNYGSDGAEALRFYRDKGEADTASGQYIPLAIAVDGKIGLGRVDPTQGLHVYDVTNADSFTVNPGLIIESSALADSPVSIMMRNNAATPDDDPVFITMGIKDNNADGEAGTTGEEGWKFGNLKNNSARFTIGYDSDGDIDDLSTGVYEGITVLSNGRVAINGGAFDTFSPSYELHVNGNAAKTSGTSSWVIASDIRLKDVQGKFELGLDEILSLNPIRFKYKENNPLGLPGEKEIIGFSAQEVQKVIPMAVNEGAEGYLHLEVDSIHWAHINATKEQQELILKNLEMLKVMQGGWEELERRVASLEEENIRLKEENEKLKLRLDKIEQLLNIK